MRPTWGAVYVLCEKEAKRNADARASSADGVGKAVVGDNRKASRGVSRLQPPVTASTAIPTSFNDVP